MFNIDIILAEPRGFCAGVERAIEIVYQTIKKYESNIPKKKIFVKHEIVHNKHVLDELKASGVTFIDDINTVPAGSVLIFSAHGVSKVIEKQALDRSLDIIDATCPLVTRVHRLAQIHENKNRKIILIGHKGHPEVEGTMGRVDSKVYLVQNLYDAEKLTLTINPEEKIGYITQTTLSMDDTTQIIQTLKSHFKNLIGGELNDICYATQNRQRAVKELAKKCNLILIIGAKNSSNSNRLRDIASRYGVTSYLIDDEQDIKAEWFTSHNNLNNSSFPKCVYDKVMLNNDTYNNSTHNNTYINNKCSIMDMQHQTQKKFDTIEDIDNIESIAQHLSKVELAELAELQKTSSVNNSYDVNDDYSLCKSSNFVIGISAGASAPEILVEKVLNFIKLNYNVCSVNTLKTINENVKFALPKQLR